MARKKETATQRERRLVMAQIKSLEKRGYIISPELKTKLQTAKYQTLASYRAKQYRKLYGEAVALSEKGDVVSGRVKRKEERAKAQEKARETRESKKREKPKTLLAKERGELIYNKILELIESNDNGKWWYGGKGLKAELEAQIGEYGFDKVMESIANCEESELMSVVQGAITYSSNSQPHKERIIALQTMIRGELPTAEDMRKMYDNIDDDDGEEYL